MQSNNPIFNRAGGFQRGGAPAYPASQQGYGDPSSWSIGSPDDPQAAQGGYGYAEPTPRMTVDSVVQKTGMTLGVVIITALATWILTPDLRGATEEQAGTVLLATMLGAGAAFILSLVNSFKKVISPALVLAFAVVEGVALGGLSKLFDAQFGDGIVTNAVLGTFAAFAGTLAAYKVFDIQVGDKFRKGVIAAMFGMVGLGLMEMVLRMFNADIGLFGFGALGLIMSIAGLVLGIFMLLLDFDFVEQGVANGLEERESWRAAFAMTVSLVWIYTNLLRILAIFSQD
ncbi:MAG: Bax inhibitor-1/YccA family protein [Nocardioides sp.]|nr:Bax inhibitor-1/YccA family protein [Nocardioides sp.]